eukprot:s53_g10.t1
MCLTRPQEPFTHSRRWAPLVAPGACLSAALSRRHQRRATAQVATSSSPTSPTSWKKLPCWGVAILGFALATAPSWLQS